MTNPSPPTELLDIDEAMRTGQIGRAITMARQALDSGIAHPVLFNLRGYWHESEGRLDAALTDLACASRLAPGDARIFVSMGRCLTHLGRLPEALIVLDEAIWLAPDLAPAHYEKAFALEQSGQLQPARASYETAHALAPAMANAAARLAALAARRSDWAETERLATLALALDPADTVAQLALVNRDMAQGDHADAEQRARVLVRSPDVVPQARANAFSVLADALDAQGRVDEAFAAYSEANAMLQSLFQGRFPGETGLPLAMRMRTAFEGLSWPSSPAPSPAPVFVLGFARAGTTLLGQILASHSRFAVAEEKPLLLDAMTDFLTPPDGLEKLMALPPDGLDHYRALYWQRAREHGLPSDRILVDQTPLHSLHLAVIARLFPQARIVLALRDPRDVVLSCFRRLFVPNPYTCEFFSLERAARFYDAAMGCVDVARARLPLQFHDLRNEALVADFDGQVRALCDFLDVPFEPQMNRFADRARSGAVATPSATQIAKGLSDSGIGQWRRYATQMASVQPILQPWVDKLGY